MTEHERAVIFKVAGGVPETLPHIHIIHTKFRQGTQILQYMAGHGITGGSFMQMFLDANKSYATIASIILKKIDSVKNRQFSIKDLQ